MNYRARLLNLSRPPLRLANAAAILTLFFSVGCADEMPSVWLVADTRILGARIEVDGDATRAWPKPGESAKASLIAVHPRLNFDDSQMESMALTCTKAAFGDAEPLCLELIEGFGQEGDAGYGSLRDMKQLYEQWINNDRFDCDAYQELQKQASELGVSLPFQLTCKRGDEPQIELTVENEPKTDAKLLIGVTCDSGKAYVDVEPDGSALSSFFNCDLNKKGRTDRWVLTVPVQTDEETNQNPAFGEVYLNKKVWPSDQELQIEERFAEKSTAKDVPCKNEVTEGLLPAVKSGEVTAKIGFEFNSSNFDTYQKKGESEREELWVAHFTTAGKLARAKSVLKKSGERVEVKWRSPKEAPSGGTLVRFFFTVRDQRGGFASTTRTLCVTK
jgi:hypothetical protein